jgi:TolB protein
MYTHEIYTMPAGGGQPTQLTDTSENAESPAFSPDGKRIAYVRFGGNDSEIYTIPADSGTRFRVTDGDNPEEFPGHPVYSPNG